MPIYAYRCEHCGHAKDVLQKVSDPLLTTCPACGTASFRKQVTAAGFQLKGSGWYVTDFRGGTGPAKTEANGSKPAESTGEGASSGPAPAPAASASGDSAPAGGCGASCACH